MIKPTNILSDYKSKLYRSCYSRSTSTLNSYAFEVTFAPTKTKIYLQNKCPRENHFCLSLACANSISKGKFQL